MYDEYLEAGMDTLQNRYLLFELGKEMFGLDIRFVTEIVAMQPINPIPETPDFIRGVINLRGKIIPVIDMRLKFGMPSIAYTDRTCIIVVDAEQLSVGLIVDRVVEVQTIDDEQIAPPPGMFTEVSHAYLSGIGKMEDRVALLLNCEKLFSENELEEARVSLYAGLKNFETTEEIKN